MAKFKPKKDEQDNETSMTLRLSESLHKRLKKYCKKEEISINKMVAQMIEHCLEDTGN